MHKEDGTICCGRRRRQEQLNARAIVPFNEMLRYRRHAMISSNRFFLLHEHSQQLKEAIVNCFFEQTHANLAPT
jgi:hypothetical protein